MNRHWLRYRFSVEMVNCYLAEMMGEDDVATNHLKEAQKIREELILLELNSRMDLFAGEK